MAFRLRIISYIVQPFRVNKTTVKNLLEKCDIILTQESLLSALNKNELDGILQNIEISCYTPANLNTRLLGGRPFGGLAIIWKIKYNICCFYVFF